MSVLSARRSAAVKSRLLVIGAAFWSILVLGMMTGTSLSRASLFRARSSSRHATCVHGGYRRRVNAKHCKASKSKHAQSHNRVVKASEKHPGVSEQPRSSTTPADEPPATKQVPPAEKAPSVNPVRTPPPLEKPPLAETPPVETPPVETPPAETPPAETPPVETPPAEPAPFRFFAPTSFWNTPVSANAPLDSNSASAVAALNTEELAELLAKRGPAIDTTSWSVPIYTVPANQPAVRVTLLNHVVPNLQAAWSEVPLPANAHPAGGTDGHLVVWQPSTDRMWEFWRLEKNGEEWRASWGGAMQGVSSNVGVYGSEAWPGASTAWGASASSLPLVGGLVTLEDLQMGKINHALAISVPNVLKGVYASPALRTDGTSTQPWSLPEGAHLRLDPTLDLASLHLPRMTLMLAEAAQRYGIYVRDKASNLAFYAEDPTPTGSNPYAGPGGYFEGQSASKLLTSFPWSHLQLLAMELH